MLLVIFSGRYVVVVVDDDVASSPELFFCRGSNAEREYRVNISFIIMEARLISLGAAETRVPEQSHDVSNGQLSTFLTFANRRLRTVVMPLPTAKHHHQSREHELG